MKLGNLKYFLRKIGYHTKPDFIIVGAQKAGTTGLYRTLVEHSNVLGSTKKEIHYFDNDEWYLKNNIAEYHSYFPFPHNISKGQLLFEATPSYLYHPKVAERLFKYNAKLKIIIMLREPASRAFSAWSMYHINFKTGKNKNLRDSQTFEEAISNELLDIDKTNFYNNQKSYVSRGIYYKQIEDYLKYFSRDQILIVESSKLLHDYELTINRIYDFLELEPEKVVLKIKNQRKKNKESVYFNEINKLKEFYQPYNERLFKLIGEKFDWR